MNIERNWNNQPKVSGLVGKTCTKVERVEVHDCDYIVFTLGTGEEFALYHEQDCCEDVHIESIVGELSDLVGSPITMAEEVSGEIEDADESGTWTFYKFAAIKGYVDIRWVGYSNGYYSEAVNFGKVVSHD